jgi:hypothetical protein
VYHLTCISKSDYWKAAWQEVDIFNKNLIEDPTKQIPGFHLPRKIWCKLNRFRTGHGKCNNMLFHWNIRENPSCECAAEKETIQPRPAPATGQAAAGVTSPQKTEFHPYRILTARH